MYVIYLIILTWDLASLNNHNKDEEADSDIDEDKMYRMKNWEYYTRRSFCILIQLYFLIYEMNQFKQEGSIQYFSDYWNFI